MKKDIRNRKLLSLGKETLKNLDDDRLKLVNAGGSCLPPPPPKS